MQHTFILVYFDTLLMYSGQRCHKPYEGFDYCVDLHLTKISTLSTISYMYALDHA